MTASLRRTALAWMTGLLALVGLVAILVAYVYVRQQTDEFLDGQLRQIALAAGAGTPAASAPPAADQDPEDEFAIAVWDAQGREVRRSLAGIELPRQERAGFADVVAGGARWRVYTFAHDGRTAQVGQRDEVRAEIVESAAIGVAAPIAIVIPLSWIVVGWAMNRMLRRLGELEAGIAARGASAKAPIPLDGVPSEIAPLVVAMNGLIERLRAAVEAQKRFLADAAHELRTPLAAMQIQVDNLTAEVGPWPSVAALAAGVKRASALVSQWLRLARLDEPASETVRRVDFGAALVESVAEAAPIAERGRIELGVDIRAAIVGEAAEADVRTLFGALIDNAVRYTPAGGSVEARLFRQGERGVVEIVDTGPGLPKGQEHRIFDRFFRGPSTDVEGAGLGLAIARRAAERNGWQVGVENRDDGLAGVCARVTWLIRP